MSTFLVTSGGAYLVTSTGARILIRPLETDFVSGPGIFSFVDGMVRNVPPWLLRTRGAKVLKGIGTAIEIEIERMVDGVGARFPNGDSPSALSKIGAERAILRGPGEDSVTYARRLRAWWDSHRTRGGAYALLRQLYPYFVTALGVTIDVISAKGVRHTVDALGNITRTELAEWLSTAPEYWARFIVVINLETAFFPVPDLSATGEPLGTFTLVPLDSLTATEEEIVRAVISQWSAAHIDEKLAILLAPGRELWGYADADHVGENVGTWASDDPSPGQVWGGTGDGVIVIC